MFEPVGPLPASVYWRRRWTALLSAVAGLVVVSLMASAMVTSPDDAQALDNRTAPLAAESPWQSSTPGSTPAANPSSPVAPPSALATPAPTPDTSERIRPDALGASSAAPAPAAAPPPPAEITCPDRTMVIVAEVDRPEFKVGERPTFRLLLANTGPTPCRRDLDSALQELFVTTATGAKRMWSSNDCFPGRSTDMRVLVPNQPVAFTVTWSGLGSAAGCKTPRTAVPAGDYRIQARLGALISVPVAFRLVPAVRPVG